jgi:hypothetical protein
MAPATASARLAITFITLPMDEHCELSRMTANTAQRNMTLAGKVAMIVRLETLQ